MKECEEDEYNLAVELSADYEHSDLYPHMITQHFSLKVLVLSAVKCRSDRKVCFAKVGSSEAWEGGGRDPR